MKEETSSSMVEKYKLQDNANILQIRLNSDYILERVRIFLTGKIQKILYKEDGSPYVKEDSIAEPKANNEGIQSILNYVENIVNSQAVQGNFTLDQYENFVDEIHDGLLTDLMNNLKVWDIKEDNYEPICNSIMVLIVPFISRLIDNEERNSYAQSIRAVESTNSMQQESKGLFK